MFHSLWVVEVERERIRSREVDGGKERCRGGKEGRLGIGGNRHLPNLYTTPTTTIRPITTLDSPFAPLGGGNGREELGCRDYGMMWGMGR